MNNLFKWVMGIAILMLILFIGIYVLGLLAALTWIILKIIIFVLAIIFVGSLIAHLLGRR